MKNYLSVSKRFLIFGTFLLASSILVSSPSRAATLSLSQGELLLTGFSQSPSGTFTSNNANTTSNSNGGSLVTRVNARAFLSEIEREGFNTSLSFATGENRNYTGNAKSDTIFRGIFNIESNTFFSFDFVGNLNLITSIDKPRAENTTASGEVFFALLDVAENNILEFFQLRGNLTTFANENFVDFETSDNVPNDSLIGEANFDGNQKFILASFQGSVQRFFPQQTTVAIIGFNRNQVTVAVPEPTATFAFVCSGVIGVISKRKQQKINSSNS